MRIAVLDGKQLNDLDWTKLNALGEIVRYDSTAPELVVERAQGAECVLVNKVKMTKEVMDQLPALRYIGVLATGYDNIDLTAASERGIVVTNVPGYSTDSVAQLIFALLLELCHHAGRHSDGVINEKKWSNQPYYSYWENPLIELAGKTMGIIGMGKIGQKTAQIARAFGMKVVAYRRTTKEIEGIVPFGSVHHDSPDALSELERLKENGIKGVKLHPDYQGFFADDDKMLPIYEKIGELGMITVFHCGFDIGYPEPVHCTPERLARIMPSFNGSPVVAAHFGGLCARPETLEHLCGKEVYLDTAYCYGMLTPRMAKELIDLHGADKILMGSDAPWNAPWQDIELVKCFGLSPEDEKAVLGENARKLLGI